MSNDVSIGNLFNILLNDDSESLDYFLQNSSDANDGVNSRLETKKIPINIIKYDQRTKIKMISSSSFYSYGDNIPILSISALLGSVQCFNLLLMCDADIYLPDTSQRLPVHFACAGGCIEICDILDSSGADFTQNDKYNRTCLHYACMSGNISLVERFWSRSFDLEAKDTNLMRPIHFASLCNNFNEKNEKDYKCLYDGGDQVFDFLVKKGCEVNAVTKDRSTCFSIALRNSPSVFNYLIENYNISDFVKPHSKSMNNEKNESDTSNNNIMSGFTYNSNAFEEMLKNINSPNDNSTKQENIKKVKEKNSKSSDEMIDLNSFLIPDEDNEDQVSPLIDACRGRRFGIVTALLKRNGDFPFNDAEKTSISIQIDNNKEASFSKEKNNKHILPIDVEQKDIYGWTPLLYAAERGSLSIVKLLVQKGANVNSKSNNGFSPLLAAKNRNHPNIAIFLEQNGALLHP